jgi:hypothetical protein
MSCNCEQCYTALCQRTGSDVLTVNNFSVQQHMYAIEKRQVFGIRFNKKKWSIVMQEDLTAVLKACLQIQCMVLSRKTVL